MVVYFCRDNCGVHFYLINSVLFFFVPEEKFVAGVIIFILTRSNKNKNITSIKHLYEAETTIDISLEHQFKRADIVDLETIRCGDSHYISLQVESGRLDKRCTSYFMGSLNLLRLQSWGLGLFASESSSFNVNSDFNSIVH